MDHVSQIKAEGLRVSAARFYHDASLRSIVLETTGELSDRLDRCDPKPEAALAVIAGISAWMLSAVKCSFKANGTRYSEEEIDAAYEVLVTTASAKMARAMGD
ncbi:hypothetical protein MRBLMC3_002900 [Sphingobium sp. LMC3-1-1.1]|uniref:hypothetical protein n=1 Tax=Sphingobium sp. LMC3-1-1.1 TaxID=3135241 RepID=UPI0034227E60